MVSFELQPEILGTSLQDTTDSSFSAFVYWQVKSGSAVIREVDLAWQFNIKSSESRISFMVELVPEAKVDKTGITAWWLFAFTNQSVAVYIHVCPAS